MKIQLTFFAFLVVFCSFGQCDTITPLNKQVLSYAQFNLNKKVGRGECWDLAKYALENCKATWDHKFEFGRHLEKGECLMPGDIIQFKGVKIKYKEGKKTLYITMEQHTAIVHKVISTDEIELIHQNTAFSGKKVGVNSIKFSTIIKGKYDVYRPQL
ncbi:MAG: hypothetical protein RI922_1667 [Bacteroidota bacterium]|jgi:hypothetical protein